MKQTSLTIVRHAESALNKVRGNKPVFFDNPETRDLFANTPDHKVPLTSQGIAQALQTGKYLLESGVRYHTAIHTGYARTKQTLEGLTKSLKVACIKEMVDFRERETGYAYVMTKDEVEKNFPWNEQYWKTFGQIFARPVGGESLMDVYTRVKPALKELISDNRGKNTLLVTHGRVISVIRFILEGFSLEEFESLVSDPRQSPINCGFTTYSFDSKLKPSLVSYNQKYW